MGDLLITSSDDDGIIVDSDDNNLLEEEDRIDNSPEGLLQQADNQKGFNNADALYYYLQAYKAEGASDEVKNTAILAAADCASLIADEDSINEVIENIFDSYKNQIITYVDLLSTIFNMFSNLVSSEAILHNLFENIISRINPDDYLDLYVDVKLRQCDQALINAKYDIAENIITDINSIIPLKPTEQSMIQNLARFRVYEIELFQRKHDKAGMKRAFAHISKIDKSLLTTYQNALVMEIQGIQSLEEGHFKEARKLFWDSFCGFDSSGSDKRYILLSYFGLTSMLLHENVNIFSMPETMRFTSHPQVAPIQQLTESYHNTDILQFLQRKKSAILVFPNEPLYENLIENIRIYVLMGSIRQLLKSYSRISIQAIAQEFQSNSTEVKEIILNFILRHELNALLEAETDVVVMIPPPRPTPQLDGLDQLMENCQKAVHKISRRYPSI